MSSVGGVGGVGGGSAGAAGAAGAASVGAGAAPSAVSDAGSAGGSSEVGKPSSKDESSAVCPTQPNEVGMSTQDFMQLRQSCVQPPEESPQMDLHKLMEWLMAIKMLEAMNGSK